MCYFWEEKRDGERAIECTMKHNKTPKYLPNHLKLIQFVLGGLH